MIIDRILEKSINVGPDDEVLVTSKYDKPIILRVYE